MTTAARRPNGGDGIPRTRPRVLVIDDDDDVREILRQALTDERDGRLLRLA